MGLENISIKLLGVPTIEVEGRSFTSFRSNRIPALLGLLASRPGPSQRDIIADSLWPDHMSSEGRHNLRQVLLYVKQLLGDQVLIARRNTVELHPDCSSDLSTLLQVNNPLLSPGEKIEAATKAIAAYRGEFLSGYEDEWVYPVRSTCTRAYISALLLLSQHLLPTNPSRSLELADRAIQAEPYLEGARAAKIHALRTLGEEASAHKEFTNYRQLLATELGIEPSHIAIDALNQEETQPPAIEPTNEQAEAINFLLASNRSRYGLDLAIAMAQYWMAKGQAVHGVEPIAFALKANEKNSSSDSFLAGKVVHAELLFVTGNTYESREILVEVLPKLGKNLTRIRALILLGRISSHSYQPQAGADFAKQGLNLANAIGSAEEQIDAYRVAAEIAFQLENPELGEEYSAVCIDLARQIGDWQSFAHATSVVAMIRYRGGRLDEAISAVQTGLDELVDKQTNRAASIRIRFYRVLEEIGDVERALDGYRQGIEDIRKFRDPVNLAIALTYLGDLLTTRREYDEAVSLHNEALSIRRELWERLGEATSLRGLGRAYRKMGQLDDAQSVLRESARLFLACDALPGHASSLLELAYVSQAMGEREMALRIASRAKELLFGMSKHARQTIGPQGDLLADDADRLVRSLIA